MATFDKNHICSRENCPPNHISGNKIRCFMCSKLYFGKCFGLDTTTYDAFAPNVPFEADSVVQFICPSCLTKPKHRPAPQMPLHDKLEEIAIKVNSFVEKQGEMNEEMSKMVENAETVNNKLVALNTIGVEAKDACYKVLQNLNGNVRTMRPSFSDIVRANSGSPSNVTRSVKRPRTEIGPNDASNSGNSVQYNRPKPRIGTSEAVIGLAMPPIRSGEVRRKFDRSLWVSRFHVDTTTDQIMDYVVAKTGCEDRTKFFCKKLVKRDADLTTLKFVSFKIDILEEFYDSLSDPSVWPNYVLVREFFNEQRNESVQVAVLGRQMHMDIEDETAQHNSSNGTANNE